MKRNPKSEMFLATLVLDLSFAVIALAMGNFFAFAGWLMAGFANFVLTFVPPSK